MTESTVVELWRLRNRFLMPPDLKTLNDRSLALLTPVAVDNRFRNSVNQLLDRFEETVTNQCNAKLEKNIDQFTETDHWTFAGSVFFSLTVFTTIGRFLVLYSIEILFAIFLVFNNLSTDRCYFQHL